MSRDVMPIIMQYKKEIENVDNVNRKEFCEFVHVFRYLYSTKFRSGTEWVYTLYNDALKVAASMFRLGMRPTPQSIMVICELHMAFVTHKALIKFGEPKTLLEALKFSRGLDCYFL